MSIVIVDYHKGNLLSVERGLVGAGADVVVTDKADVIRAADAVVLPGVGAFADAAASMEEMGQMEAVRAAVAGGSPDRRLEREKAQCLQGFRRFLTRVRTLERPALNANAPKR